MSATGRNAFNIKASAAGSRPVFLQLLTGGAIRKRTVSARRAIRRCAVRRAHWREGSMPTVIFCGKCGGSIPIGVARDVQPGPDGAPVHRHYQCVPRRKKGEGATPGAKKAG